MPPARATARPCWLGLAVRPPPVVPIVSQWDANLVNSFNGAFSSSFVFGDRLTGKDIGAVFTFGMGYNVTWGRWLAGIQSEVSYNKTLINATGSATSTSTNPGGFNTFTQDVRADIERNWTISEMARIGYLVAPDWLVYGLVGWSWSGFDFRGDTGNGAVALPFTLSGVTWGAGVEKDFGWMRAFVQYKGIDFGSKDVSLPSFSSTTFINGGVVQTFQTSGTDVRRLSAVA